MFTLYKKSQSLDVLKNFKVKVENQLRKRIKKVSDLTMADVIVLGKNI